MDENNNTPVLVLDETVAYVPSKGEVATAAAKLVEKVEEGYMDPLLALGQLTALESVIKAAKERIAEPALAAAEKYEKGGTIPFGAYNCDFQVKEAGVKYDYSANAHWQSLKETADLANAELKSHEDLLKRMKQCGKSSKTIVQVTLRK